MKSWKIQIGLVMPEETCGVLTPNEMRQAMNRQSRDSAIIAQAFQVAHHNGLSGEDLYTVLAYHALVTLERYAQDSLYLQARMPDPGLMMRDGPVARADIGTFFRCCKRYGHHAASCEHALECCKVIRENLPHG